MEVSFLECTTLHEITLPPSVKVIKGDAFCRCSQLTIFILGQGLEEIEDGEFSKCTWLHEITIPPAVKVIKGDAFSSCSRLLTVNLGEGLAEIGRRAFSACTSLHEITIPPPVSRHYVTMHLNGVRN